MDQQTQQQPHSWAKTKSALAQLDAASVRMDAEMTDESALAWQMAQVAVGDAFAEEGYAAGLHRDRELTSTARHIAYISATEAGREWIERAVRS